MAAQGLVALGSFFSVKETTDRLMRAINVRGMTLFARIDHAAGGDSVGMPLRPTELVIFGNARAGTPLMQANQEMAIDLPLKVLIYQDSNQKVWLTYNDPNWLAKRHGIGAELASNLTAITSTLATVTTKAAGCP